MAGMKYSRQREAILAYLHSTKEGTVYRNLNLLAVSGEIQRLSCGDGTDHFDATTTPHSHFVCKGCGRVMDLDMPWISLMNDKFLSEIKDFGGEIYSHQVFFYGLCKKCL